MDEKVFYRADLNRIFLFTYHIPNPSVEYFVVYLEGYDDKAEKKFVNDLKFDCAEKLDSFWNDNQFEYLGEL